MLLLSNIHLDLEHPPSVVTFPLKLSFQKRYVNCKFPEKYAETP